MAVKRNKETVTTTIRMASDLRAMLESIASRENRSLSGQMIHFLYGACERYMEQNALSYYPDIQEVGNEEEHQMYLDNIRPID